MKGKREIEVQTMRVLDRCTKSQLNTTDPMQFLEASPPTEKKSSNGG